jgi:hypothetical protein
MATNPPIESWNDIDYENYEVPIHYCKEQDVYDATGYTKDFIMKIGELTGDQASNLINKFIATADGEIRRRLGVPTVIKKELHQFMNTRMFS